MYLFDSRSLNKTSAACSPFKIDSKSNVQRMGTKLLQKLFEIENVPEDSNETDEVSFVELSFQEELKLKVGNRWGAASRNSAPTMEPSAIAKCFRSYEQTGTKGPLLIKLFRALCGVPPTSTQSERNFSLVGNFITKSRTRLTSTHVDMLSFLKSYFLNQR